VQWSELKALVEIQLKLAGVKDCELDYLDACFFSDSVRIELGAFGLTIIDDELDEPILDVKKKRIRKPSSR
jgi:hypothetical protein